MYVIYHCNQYEDASCSRNVEKMKQTKLQSKSRKEVLFVQ